MNKDLEETLVMSPSLSLEKARSHKPNKHIINNIPQTNQTERFSMDSGGNLSQNETEQSNKLKDDLNPIYTSMFDMKTGKGNKHNKHKSKKRNKKIIQTIGKQVNQPSQESMEFTAKVIITYNVIILMTIGF